VRRYPPQWKLDEEEWHRRRANYEARTRSLKEGLVRIVGGDGLLRRGLDIPTRGTIVASLSDPRKYNEPVAHFRRYPGFGYGEDGGIGIVYFVDPDILPAGNPLPGLTTGLLWLGGLFVGSAAVVGTAYAVKQAASPPAMTPAQIAAQQAAFAAARDAQAAAASAAAGGSAASSPAPPGGSAPAPPGGAPASPGGAPAPPGGSAPAPPGGAPASPGGAPAPPGGAPAPPGGTTANPVLTADQAGSQAAQNQQAAAASAQAGGPATSGGQFGQYATTPPTPPTSPAPPAAPPAGPPSAPVCFGNYCPGNAVPQVPGASAIRGNVRG
jgi:hypothetical protein